jgi:hypothetical protein
MIAKLQTPSSKHQINTKLQTANSKEHGAETLFSFGVSSLDRAVLKFGAYLVFDVWCLVF